MKKLAARLMLPCLFVLSLGTLGIAFATVASADDELACPACESVTLSCPGSPCACKWNDFGQKYQCVKSGDDPVPEG